MGLRRRLELEAAAAVCALLGDHVVVCDTEPAGGARVFEIGLVRLTYGHVEAVESLLVDPGDAVLGPAVGGKAKRAKRDLVDGAGTFGEQAAHFYQFVEGHSRFVGWKVSSERDHLANEFLLAHLPFGEHTWVDGMDLEYLRADRKSHQPGLQACWDSTFTQPWTQQHHALDDALHTAHLVRELCRRLYADGKVPEQIATRGWLGRGWPPVQALHEPKRRFPLPPQPNDSFFRRRGYWAAVDGWRAAERLVARRPGSGSAGFSRSGPEAQVRLQQRRQQWFDSGLNGPRRYEMPVPRVLQSSYDALPPPDRGVSTHLA